MKKIMSILTLAVALFLTACSQHEQQQKVSSSASSNSSETVASTNEKPEQGVSIDEMEAIGDRMRRIQFYWL